MDINPIRVVSNDDKLELQKVFSVICSSKFIENEDINQINYLNEHNVFTINNVAGFIQRMSKNVFISKQNVGPVMPLLDGSFSGLISWESFTQSMDEFLNKANCLEGIYKRRSSLVLGYHEKRIFHTAIANFFLLNSKDIGNTLDQLHETVAQVSSRFDFQMLELNFETDIDRNNIIRDSLELLENFANIAKEISNPLTIRDGFIHLNRIFRVIPYSKSPLEVNMYSKTLFRTFDLIMNANLFEIILRAIISNDSPLELKYDALKTLSFLTYCLKVKTPDFDGSAFLKNQIIKNNLFHPEFLSILLAGSCCDWIEIRHQSLMCLAFIIEIDEESRNNLINMNIVQSLAPFINQEKLDLVHIEAIGLVLSALAANISFSFNANFEKSFLLALVDAGYKLISTKDHLGILKTGFSVLGPVTPLIGISSEMKILFERMLEILRLHNNMFVRKCSLMAIKDIVENSETQTQMLVDLKLFPILIGILNENDHNLKLLSCRILHLLVRTHALQILDPKVFGAIQKTINDTPHCRWECFKIMKSLSGHSQTCVNLLVENSIIKQIFVNLAYFKENDEILNEAYAYQGRYMNMPYLIDCLSIMNSILIKGVTKGTGNGNLFADYFDRENIDKLQLLVEEIFEDPQELKSQLNRSYVKTHGDDTFEKLLVEFIYNIKNTHKNRDSDISKAIVAQLTSLLFVIASKFEQLDIAQIPIDLVGDTMIEVRCMTSEGYPNGDNRIVEVSRNIDYYNFLCQIQVKYGNFNPTLLKFIDKNNEMFTIDNDQILQKAINEILEEVVLQKFNKKKPEMRIIVEFQSSPYPNQPTEVQCFECGKRFEVIKLYEEINAGELFICSNCKEEMKLSQTQSPSNFMPFSPFKQNYPGYFYK